MRAKLPSIILWTLFAIASVVHFLAAYLVRAAPGPEWVAATKNFLAPFGGVYVWIGISLLLALALIIRSKHKIKMTLLTLFIIFMSNEGIVFMYTVFYIMRQGNITH